MKINQVLTLRPGDVVEDTFIRQRGTVVDQTVSDGRVAVLIRWHDTGREVARYHSGFKHTRLVSRAQTQGVDR